MAYMGAVEADLLQVAGQLLRERSTPIVLEVGEKFVIPARKQAFFSIPITVKPKSMIVIEKGAQLVQVI